MKISDLKEEDIKVGMRVKSLISDKLGTIFSIEVNNDRLAWIQWDGDKESLSGFYGNQCECEVIEQDKLECPCNSEKQVTCEYCGHTICIFCYNALGHEHGKCIDSE